jgi:hypothetical protein
MMNWMNWIGMSNEGLIFSPNHPSRGDKFIIMYNVKVYIYKDYYILNRISK